MADRPQRRRALRRSKLIVLVHELGRVVGLVVSVIEGVRTDVERLQSCSSSSNFAMIAGHIDSGTTARTACTGLGQRYLQLEDFGVPLTPVEDGLQLRGRARPVSTLTSVRSSTRVLNALFIATS